MDAVEIANLKLAIQRVPLRIYLTAAGEFLSETEKQKFFARVLRSDIKPIEPSDFRQNRVEYLGYVSGEAKKKLLEQSDGLVLPTYFHTEAQPLVLIEALAYGLEIVVSDWRHLPEMLPSSARAITPKDPQALAKTLIQAACQNSALVHRRYFLETFEERKIRERIPAIFA
jgi:glycosyltransferase involved in cell wall biosynthesis